MAILTELDFKNDGIPSAPSECTVKIPSSTFVMSDILVIQDILFNKYEDTINNMDAWYSVKRTELGFGTGSPCDSIKDTSTGLDSAVFVINTKNNNDGWWHPGAFASTSQPYHGYPSIDPCENTIDWGYMNSNPLVVYACETPAGAPVNGNYTDWSAWSACSVSCGGGMQSQSRTCTNPSPADGGSNCTQQSLGDASASQPCNTQSCAVNSGISATCNDDNTITVTIDYDQDSSILSASYGSCNETDMRGADVSDVKTWDVTLDPASCDMESKLRNLVYNQTATFTVGRKDGNFELVFATFEVDSYCNYTSEYTVTFAYGPVNADVYDFTDSGGLLGLNFYISSFGNGSYVNEAAPSNSAGDTIYLKIALNATLNADFDHAADMNASTGKVFVPTKCEVEDDSSNSYALFDVNGQKCTNDIIELSMTYNSGDPQSWYMEHTLFLLNSESSSSYTLSCNILVCDAERITACKNAATCITA